MHSRRPGIDRSERVRHAQAPVTVAMPVDTDVPTALVDEPAHERDDGADTIGSGVADGIGHTHTFGAGANRRRVEAPQRLGMRSRRVLGDVEDRQAFLDRERHRLLGGADQEINGPVLDILANLAGADEGGDLDPEARALGDVDDRLDVGGERARRTIGANRQALADDFAGEPFDIGGHVRAGAGQADVGDVDAQPFHQMEDLQLLVDAGRADRRRLETVAQRLVGHHHERRRTCRFAPVPVVDQIHVGDGRVFARSLSVSPVPAARRP